MSWTEELYKIYDNNNDHDCSDESVKLIPVSHSTQNAQIEVTLRDDGTILNAVRIDKENAVTIIPVTEDSGTRSSGICPMPLADKLIYISGDYPKYGNGKYAENIDYYTAYMDQLKAWNESEYSHPAVNAIYCYLSKATLLEDLIKFNVIVIDAKTNKIDENEKIEGNYQKDAFVRFRVNYKDDFERENRTWLDTSLYSCFINYNNTLLNNVQLCYATGTLQPVTYKHPSKIRNAGDKAKLISSNDESGFTYRGRFDNKEQAISVGYEYSQKIHKALTWLISKQGISFGGSLNVVLWASAMQPVKFDTVSKSSQELLFEFFDEDDNIPDTEPKHTEMIEDMIFGFKNKYEPNSKVMLMGVDAATTGRLSVSMYSELLCSDFYDNILSWHKETSWQRFSTKYKKDIIGSSSLYEIINCAFGTEQGTSGLTCKAEVFKENMLRLIPCVTEGRAIPSDIVMALVRKASNPLSYEKRYNHREVLETACSMIKKNNLKRGGITSMGYDPNEKNRSYLYGCLLAIADKAESSTYEDKDKESRITNARRYWNSFSSRPYMTWGNIYKNLRPYLDKMGKNKFYYEKLINEITEKMSPEEFMNNSPLEPAYLLGYHHFISYMYKGKNNE